MKRFPKASYIRDQLHRLFVTAMLALAALALLGKAAHAQACGDLGDVPSVVLDDYVETLGGLFPLDADDSIATTPPAGSSTASRLCSSSRPTARTPNATGASRPSSRARAGASTSPS